MLFVHRNGEPAPPKGSARRRMRFQTAAPGRTKKLNKAAKAPRTGASSLTLQLTEQFKPELARPLQQQNHEHHRSPVSGTLVQAGRGFPSLIPVRHVQDAGPRFWGPWYRQAGNPLLYTGAHRQQGDQSLPLWGPWYRQAGVSLFYCSRRRTSSRQRPSTSSPLHCPRSGRAATRFSNRP